MNALRVRAGTDFKSISMEVAVRDWAEAEGRACASSVGKIGLENRSVAARARDVVAVIMGRANSSIGLLSSCCCC